MFASTHGYAFKRGRLRKNWKRRYFVLDEEGFNYYRNNSKTERRGGCTLDKLLHAENIDQVPCPHPGWTLLVTMSHRNMYMQLCSESERQRWREALLSLISLNGHFEHSPNQRKSPITINENEHISQHDHIAVTIKEKQELPHSKLLEEVQEESFMREIEYATPDKIVYEIPEGPFLRNVKSAMMTLLPNQMNITFTAIPCSQTEGYTSADCNMAKYTTATCSAFDCQPLPGHFLEQCVSFIKILDDSPSKQVISPNDPLDYCPWIQSSNLEEIQSKLNQLFDVWIDIDNNTQKVRSHEYYWNNLYVMLKIISQSLELSQELKTKLFMTFSATLSTYIDTTAKIIIDELMVPFGEKTIPPVDDVSYPYQKYERNGVQFMFTADSERKLNDNEFIQKRIAQEFRTSQWLSYLLDCTEPSFMVPLTFIIDYWGFRMIARPLVPVKRESLVYGMDKDGVPVNVVPEINTLIPHLYSAFRLHSESSQSRESFSVHIGDDGRFYPSQLASLCASEPPVAGKIACEFYRFFRFEYQLSHDIPLHSKCFSSQCDALSGETHRRNIFKAQDTLLTIRIPNCIENLKSCTYKLLLLGSDFLLGYIHAHGINCRYLGFLRSYLSTRKGSLRDMILEEMIVRVYKNVLRGQMRRHLLQHEKEEGAGELRIGVLVWKTIYSLYHMDEIGEDLNWQETIVPAMINQFGDFLSLPGNQDINPFINAPALLLRQFVNLPRLAKRLCKLMNVRLHIDNWEECNRLETPRITYWERNIRVEVRLLLPHYNYWWKRLLADLDYREFEFSCDVNDRGGFMKRLRRTPTVLPIIRHLIRLCKTIIYEKSCHNTEEQQRVLFFLASVVDESIDEITVDPLIVSHVFSRSAFDKAAASTFNLTAKQIIEDENIASVTALQAVFNLPCQSLYRKIHCSSLCSVVLNVVVEILPGIDLNNDRHRLQFQNEISFVRGLLVMCHKDLRQSLVEEPEQLLLCYELTLRAFSTPNESLSQFYFLICFLDDLDRLTKENLELYEVRIRTYVQLFWYLQKMLVSSDVELAKRRIYNAYNLSKQVAGCAKTLPTTIYFLIHRCETVLNVDENPPVASPEEFVNDIRQAYFPYLLNKINLSLSNYLTLSKKKLAQSRNRL